jgi:hypothetical protein
MLSLLRITSSRDLIVRLAGIGCVRIVLPKRRQRRPRRKSI